MHLRLWRLPRQAIAWTAPGVLLAASLVMVSGCGAMSSLGGGDDGTGASSGGLAGGGIPALPKITDPNDRPTRVGWLSARASLCGFVFDPAQLRAQYFAFEQSYGADGRRMQEVQRAYDYSVESTTARAKKDTKYCTKKRVDQIRPELNRYLAGDFRLL